MTRFSRHQQFHLAAVGPRQCHRTSAKKRPCQPPSDRPNQSPRMATQLFVGFCMELSDFDSPKSAYLSQSFSDFSVNKLHIQRHPALYRSLRQSTGGGRGGHSFASDFLGQWKDVGKSSFPTDTPSESGEFMGILHCDFG